MTLRTVQGWFSAPLRWLSPVADWFSPAFEQLDPDGGSTAPERRIVGLNVALLGTLAVLFVVGGAGLPRWVVVLALGGYAAIALGWVWAQYRESLESTPTVPTWRTVAGVCALGVLAVGYGLLVGPPETESAEPLTGFEHLALVRGPGVLLLVGIIALYWGFGFVIVRTRAGIGQALDGPQPHGVTTSPELGRVERLLLWMGTPQRVPVPVLAIGVMLVLVTAGLGLLGSVASAPLLIGLGVLAFPFALSLLSETAIRWCERLSADRRWLVLLTGAFVAMVGTLVSWGLGDSKLPLILMLALGLLIVAIASATLIDVAVVLAAVALLGVTVPPDENLPEVVDPAGVMVSLGDSYMSGEGADRYIEGTDVGGGNECRQARTAWAVRASEELREDGEVTGLVFLACSGADSFNIRYATGEQLDPEPEPQYLPGRTQLADYRERFGDAAGKPALVVLSIGGNDAGFASIGLTCLAPGDCDDDQPSNLWSEGNMQRVENRLRQVYTQVRSTFGTTPVVVAPYPDPLDVSAPCASADLSEGDVRFIRTFLTRLNATIRSVTDDYGFYFAEPMVDALKQEGLQLCGDADDGPGINFIGIRGVGGFVEHRLNPTKWHHNSLHPNARGHAAMNEAFQFWLDQQQNGTDRGLAALGSPTERTAAVRGAAPVDEKYVARFSGCAAYKIDHERGCRALSTNWALREAGVFLLSRGTWVLLTIIGAWLVGVAFFGDRRARYDARQVSP